ncbi:dATP pyrophosphohydrolase [Xylophilus sp. GOD-11R]|uniref:dATP pyrophosphohydrolase n=1 Tax=Xylophilus sp. GOD-11R TaxID=3089814 RepID=UPI00298C3B4C|nr:dATP pyrophosphohydrolase [Xylophilus sp. GOD-11R]WPB58958.1 dATP pyrophosphohydrolase [Xylophilus sp. GOD-11R]
MNPIEIIPVRTPAELTRFIKLPAQIHAQDPNFVTQLTMERQEALSPKKNPYFAHAETQFWLARRDGRDVGRISAQIDKLVQDPEIGHFGMICAIDDADVFAALFAAAEAWLAARGKTRVIGPFNLSINEETGLLVDGFDTPPMMLMPHDAPYAGARVEAQGYAKAKDLIAYLYDIEHELPAAARRMIGPRKPAALTVRNLDTSRYIEEFDTVTAIFNDAWSQNWGFIPFTKAEIAHMAKSLKMFIDPKCVAIVELNGKAVGFGIALPNLNEMIADFGGALFPFNWAKLLLRLKRGTKTARVPLMGISRSISGELAGAIAPFLAIDTMRQGLRAKGVKQVELSWILEDNRPMRHIIESLGADPYKTYRVYEKRLDGAGAGSV